MTTVHELIYSFSNAISQRR